MTASRNRLTAYLRTALPFVALALISCGGGSSDGESISLNFSKSPIKLVKYEGEQEREFVEVTVSGDFSGIDQVYVSLVLPNVFTSDSFVSQYSQRDYALTLLTNPETTAGKYSGNIIVNVCGDSRCDTRIGGSPFSLAYDITVDSHTNLTQLTPVLNGTDWSTYRGNNQHTGHTPVTLDANNFSLRWIKRIEKDESSSPRQHEFGLSGISNLVAAEGNVYFTHTTNDSTAITALSETDGSTSWSHTSISNNYSDPAYNDSYVYVVADKYDSDLEALIPVLAPYHAATGIAQQTTPLANRALRLHGQPIMGATFSSDSAFVVLAHAVIATSLSDDALKWEHQFDSLTYSAPVIVDSDVVLYGYKREDGDHNIGVYTLSESSGDQLNYVQDDISINQNTWFRYDSHTTPILTGDGDLLITTITDDDHTSDRMVRLYNPIQQNFTANSDVSTRSRTNINSQPVYGLDSVYVLTGFNGQARAYNKSLSSSEIISTPFSGGITDLAATNTHLFMSTDAAVYAIDLNNLQVVWTYNAGAEKIAISKNGILYLARFDSRIAAINLH